MIHQQLSDGEVHLWTVRLEGGPDLELSKAVLDPEEAARAQRFVFERDRIRFAFARGTLRLLAGAYLGEDPRHIRFAYGPKGKPSLAGERRLRLNLSHSGSLAVYGFVLDDEIGVDVECIRDIEIEAIAPRFFAPEECDAVLRHGAETRRQAFFHCWTRKEAYMKADGRGFSLGLKEFAVSVPPDDPPRLLRTANDAHVQMYSWCPAEGYVAAAAVAGAVDKLFVERSFEP